MVEHRNSRHYDRGLELAETNRHQEALASMLEHLRQHPDDPEAMNDVGAILHCMRRWDEAIDYLVRARGFMPHSAEVLWNLCEVYIDSGRAVEAAKLFGDMAGLGILNPDVLNRTANVFLQTEDLPCAVEMLLQSLDMAPAQQSILKPILDAIHSKRPKIAFFCGADGMTFLRDIIGYVQQRFEVRLFEGRTDQEMMDLMRWCDIAWFEWCTNLAVLASHKPKVCKTIVRLHRYEAYEAWPEKVNWSNVDVLVTPGNPVTLGTLKERVPQIDQLTSVLCIPNGVDLDRFRFQDRPRGKNLAFLGNLRMVKNPALMLQCMQKLHYLDPQARLFFGGEVQDRMLEQYLHHMVRTLGLESVVSFDGRQDDPAAWLADKHYIVSTSLCEGHPVGLLEGMACGLKPVIHHFLGADHWFPEEFLFTISEQFCEQVLSGPYEPARYRRFVEERYGLGDQLNRVNEVLVALEGQIGQTRQQTAQPAFAF